MLSKGFEVVVPTRAGKDLESHDRARDAHIRIESDKQVGTRIYVDLFDSMIEDPGNANIESRMFEWSDNGAKEATRFLQGYGFRVVVMIK